MADKWRVQNSWVDTGIKVGNSVRIFFGIVVACGSVPDTESRGRGFEPQCLRVASWRMRMIRCLINGGYKTPQLPLSPGPGEIPMGIKVGNSVRNLWGSWWLVVVCLTQNQEVLGLKPNVFMLHLG